MIYPPVGAICLHVPLQSWAHVCLPGFRTDDEGSAIFYHSYHLLDDGKPTVRWDLCARPELYMWRRHVRECGGCGKEFSNPWVPVCPDCWEDPYPYPSWEFILRKDLGK